MWMFIACFFMFLVFWMNTGLLILFKTDYDRFTFVQKFRTTGGASVFLVLAFSDILAVVSVFVGFLPRFRTDVYLCGCIRFYYGRGQNLRF